MSLSMEPEIVYSNPLFTSMCVWKLFRFYKMEVNNLEILLIDTKFSL